MAGDSIFQGKHIFGTLRDDSSQDLVSPNEGPEITDRWGQGTLGKGGHTVGAGLQGALSPHPTENLGGYRVHNSLGGGQGHAARTESREYTAPIV